jgi:HCOMODA/2-hydroxy-3-carboxy-muconic semialdehyde decarboxylase
VIFRSVYTEVNARVQMQAMALGTPVDYLSPEEAELAEKTNSGQYDRPWDLWKTQATAARRKI